VLGRRWAAVVEMASVAGEAAEVWCVAVVVA